MRAGLVTLVLVMACSSTPAERAVAMGESFQLRTGEVAIVAGAKLKFMAVEGDSRCPEGVQCVWEGSALLRFAVGEEGREVTLETSHRVAAMSASAQIVFEALEPAATQGKEIAPGEYRVRLRVEPLAAS